MKRYRMSNMQVIALGFFLIIMVGTLLLKLPFATRSGESASWLTALFTATSASCVTGLVVADTYLYWSTFGQLVIISLIQLGGLGFMTIGIFLLVFLKRKVGLSQRGLMQESVNALHVGGMVKLTKIILKGTLLIEAIGAILFSFRFVPMLGLGTGIYYSIFHSISAFCNAGFDLMGRFGEYISLSMFYGDGLINFTVIMLITVAGLGFVVWQDLLDKGLHFKKYRLHTKIVLVTTIAVFVVTTLLFLLFEWDNTLVNMSLKEKIYSAMFSSVTPRTAGFNTIDTAALNDSSKFLTIILMFIGGSPGSTAGGIKTTTFIVMIVYLWTNLRNKTGCNIFGRRLDDDVIKKAGLVFYFNLFLIVSATLVICSMENINFIDILFEVFSAMGTVGMTTGITRDLCTASKLILVLLMYCGRIGGMTFAMSFVEKRKNAPVKLPIEKITVG